MKKNIVMLTGSPRAEGTTSALADAFCKGAGEAGHQVIRFDTARLKIHPCTGCDYCRENNEQCVFSDDMEEIYRALKMADVVVFVSPLYYFGMTAQLKTAIDRFYAINPFLRQKPVTAYLLGAGADEDPWVMEAMCAHMKVMCRYLKWSYERGIMALGAGTPEDLAETNHQEQCYDLGRELK